MHMVVEVSWENVSNVRLVDAIRAGSRVHVCTTARTFQRLFRVYVSDISACNT